jgi:hypothetical protein
MEIWNYKIPTRAANFVDSPNASSRSVMFLTTSPKNECTLAGQLMEGVGFELSLTARTPRRQALRATSAGKRRINDGRTRVW